MSNLYKPFKIFDAQNNEMEGNIYIGILTIGWIAVISIEPLSMCIVMATNGGILYLEFVISATEITISYLVATAFSEDMPPKLGQTILLYISNLRTTL